MPPKPEPTNNQLANFPVIGTRSCTRVTKDGKMEDMNKPVQILAIQSTMEEDGQINIAPMLIMQPAKSNDRIRTGRQ